MHVERERAMGFPEGYTQVVGILKTQRQETLGKVMDPHTLQFMIQVCKSMASIADNFCMPSTYVLTSHNLGVTGVANETGLSSEAKCLSPPRFKKAQRNARQVARALMHNNCYDIQRKQHVQQ